MAELDLFTFGRSPERLRELAAQAEQLAEICSSESSARALMLTAEGFSHDADALDEVAKTKP